MDRKVVELDSNPFDDRYTVVYTRIAEALLELGPAEATTFRVRATVTDEWSDVMWEYEDNSGQVHWRDVDDDELPLIYGITRDMAEIRLLMSELHDPWSRCVFTLNPDHSVHLTYSYEPVGD